MAARNYDAAFKAMIAHEGGYTNHPNDKGGPTNLGITQAVLASWLKRKVSAVEVRKLTLADVKPIYKANYANAIRFDDLPSGIDYLAFDFAVNSGPSRAAKYLQALVDVEQDGYIGPATIAAVNREYAKSPAGLINEYADRREAFFRSIIKNNPSQKVFERGWLNRIAEARRLALTMAKTPAAPTAAPKPVTPQPVAPKPGFWASVFARFK
jgi:lysozyme family protein